MQIVHRPRRNRKTLPVRDMVQESFVNISQFIYPMFVTGGNTEQILSMQGIYRYDIESLLKEIEICVKLGILNYCIFPHYPDEKKDAWATESYNEKGLYLTAIKKIKANFPHITLMTDVAMDPYSIHGHDGIYADGKIVNDATLDILSKMAVAQAHAGADMVGPSDMMDGRVAHIRQALDNEGFTDTSIIAYTAKYASALYGPFRDALQSAPKAGDKKTYQMNPANAKEALLEANLDADEGADILMVKPAGMYLDVIQSLKNNFLHPIAAYQVSGEYAMIKAASAQGWIDHDAVMYESLISIKRAGADIILTYFAKQFAQKFGKTS
ncbi:MAG: porphobilinogen synthase [Cytophagales bacterium]|nr:porphobilinogen synthase [Cytophagales bacterium]